MDSRYIGIIVTCITILISLIIIVRKNYYHKKERVKPIGEQSIRKHYYKGVK